MSSYPNPSKLVFLSQLKGLESETKVRFLGCTTNYDVASATLTLAHHYPNALPTLTSVLVNVRPALESTDTTCFQDGSWVNVIGYITADTATTSAEGKASRAKGKTKVTTAHVHATMIWSAGAIKVEDYEKTVELRMSVADTSTV